MTSRRDKIVLLGMMGRMRVAGAVWQALHYLVGLERLGYEAYYIEAHGCTPWAFREDEAAVAGFINGVMRRFDLGDRWGFHARSGSGSWYGMNEHQVNRLYGSAAAIVNLHGGTVPTPEQSATGRLVYIDTDPVSVQVEVHNGVPSTLDFLEQHCAFFTFAENYSAADCQLPVSERFRFKPTRQPVVLDFWRGVGAQACPPTRFTTVGNWRQLRRVVEYKGEEYHWSKHLEFLKFLDLPSRTPQEFELALSGCDEEAQILLRSSGWKVSDAFSFSHEMDAYRQYITESKAEFTVAKDQNIRLRTGWFSDRSATYLAAGRPVITQETGFSNVFPTGAGLFGFSSMDEIVGAVEAINCDYERHSRAASDIAHEYFSHEVVLSRLLSEIGLGHRAARLPRAEINIVGYFGAASGMGTAARRYMRALESAGFSPNVIDVGQISGLPTAECGINLICCDIAAYFAVRSDLGEDFFRNRYNIGLWLWELPGFPPAWHDRFAYHDEIWAPSSFIAASLAPVSPIPVVRIPLVLEPEIRGREKSASLEYTFAFIFNCHSSFARKNPLAVIDAFNAAFRPEEPARLVIKCANAGFDRNQFQEMQKRAEGRRISIHAEEWSAGEIADLVAECDCYVSLHRGEGVALTISDAMAAGKPVIATGWSGNMDFMNVSNSFPVRYRLVELEYRVAHYPPGGIWAEPSVEHAAELMRYVFEHREEAAAKGELARREIEANYSNEAIARMLAARIELISQRDRFQELRHWLAQPSAPGSRDAAGTGACATDDFCDLGAYMPAEHLRYLELKAELQRVVREHVPRKEVLVVVSKGDEDLLKLHDGPAWHFPQGADRKYAGYYPEDSSEAIRHLDSLREQGGRFLLFPRTAFWWLEHYAGFSDYLQQQYRLAHSGEACRIFELVRRQAAPMEAA
jgi:glycosyltransferase involved in cell wall biosynthesis